MTMMRRWEMSALGRTNLVLANAPIPDPKPGEILVKVAAVALNYRDRLAIENGMGLEGSGRLTGEDSNELSLPHPLADQPAR